MNSNTAFSTPYAAPAQSRLHIARKVTAVNVREAPSDEAVYAALEQGAAQVIDIAHLTSISAWVLASYVDMADVGCGSKNSLLYHRAMLRLTSFVGAHSHEPQVRAMCGRAAVLGDLLHRAQTGESRWS